MPLYGLYTAIIFGIGALSGAKGQIVNFFAIARAVDRATAGVSGPGGKIFRILCKFKTRKAPVNGIVKNSNSHSGCKNEQQADFEAQLENKITFTRHK